MLLRPLLFYTGFEYNAVRLLYMKRNINMKKVLCLVLSVILVLGVSGCMDNVKIEKQRKLVEEAAEYLEKKYDEEFTNVSVISESIAVSFNEVIFSPKLKPDISFSVYEDDGQFRDDYYGKLIHAEYDDLIRGMLEKEITGIKVFSMFTAGYFDDKFTSKTTLTEALETDKNQFFSNVYVFAAEGNIDEELFKSICNEIESNNLKLYIAIYEIDEKSFDELNEENYLKYLDENYKLTPVYKKTVN